MQQVQQTPPMQPMQQPAMEPQAAPVVEASAPRPVQGTPSADPVLGSVMAQFEMLRKDVAGRRKKKAAAAAP